MSECEFATMREIAKLLGSTSHKVGRALKRLGLRLEDGNPSPGAHQQGFVKKRPVFGKETIDVWLWHAAKTFPLLHAEELHLQSRDHE